MTLRHQTPGPWRALSDQERQLVETLLLDGLPGRDAVLNQLRYARVRRHACRHKDCVCGDYDLETSSGQRAPKLEAPYSSANWTDPATGAHFELLLFLDRGLISHLQVVNYFDVVLPELPAVETLTIASKNL